MSATFLYVATLTDRHGDQDEHLDLLVPGDNQRSRDAWCAAVQAGIVAALGRSGNLVELVVSADCAPVLGIGCPVDDAVRECVAYLRRLDGEQPQAVAS